jgi:hypothetical protein
VPEALQEQQAAGRLALVEREHDQELVGGAEVGPPAEGLELSAGGFGAAAPLLPVAGVGEVDPHARGHRREQQQDDQGADDSVHHATSGRRPTATSVTSS